MKIHPLAELVPTMPEDQFAELRSDIAAHGLLEPIVMYEGMVLDGRHRLRACEESRTTPRFREFEGSSAAEFVLSVNVKRRHLTVSQRAAVAVEFLPEIEREKATLKAHLARGQQGSNGRFAAVGDPRITNGHKAREDAGAMVGVSGATIDRAKRVKREDPEVFEQVKAGAVTVREADDALRERRAAPPPPSLPERSASTPALEGRHLNIANAHKQRVIKLISGLAGFAGGVDSVDVQKVRAVMEPAELEEWIRSLGDSLSTLRRFRTDLEKGRS